MAYRIGISPWQFLRLTCLLPALCLFPLLFPATVHAQDAICARVKIEIVQELALERQAFEARMRINNGLPSPLENVVVNVSFTDENGAPVLATSDPDNTSASFFIRVDNLDGIDNVSGTGTVAAQSAAEITWLIIPAPGTGGQVSTGTLYYVGATLNYTAVGVAETIEVSPDYIFVKPMPELALDYFLTEDIFADDAFTPAVEPAEPFTLGVRVRNDGFGPARSLSIDSAQPRIIDNEQGLLINFVITGSSVNDQPTTPSLLIDMGDIAAGGVAVGRWVMETTLSGRFIDFEADFVHDDELGGALTSLISGVNTHFLVRDVLVDEAGRDGVRDFLALDGDTLRVYESNGVDTEVTDQSASASLSQQAVNGDSLAYVLETPVTAGLMYVRLPDPFFGARRVSEALRSDGKRISPHNVWFSRTRRENNSWAYWFNLFDSNSTGRYVLDLGPLADGPQPPVMQFIPDRTTRVGRQIAFLVEASDPNGTLPTVSLSPQPLGATFLDETDSAVLRTMVFDWTPVQGQEGIYDVVFTASDGELRTSQTARITVEGGSGIAITPDALQDGEVGVSYIALLRAEGGTGPYRWSEAGGALPPGLVLSSNGSLLGIPSTSGNFDFMVRATDANGASATARFEDLWIEGDDVIPGGETIFSDGFE